MSNYAWSRRLFLYAIALAAVCVGFSIANFWVDLEGAAFSALATSAVFLAMSWSALSRAYWEVQNLPRGRGWQGDSVQLDDASWPNNKEATE